ncbi:hypothetical protein SALB_07504 [Streptomyces noursei]|uniref:Uncharacterized protein n=1 Tax=Streptomyces noursei TaxID=1971 RepID=A0A401RAX2_STRNR|nr:hypothetical protein SALB_07504 [Streptomyces noursei]
MICGKCDQSIQAGEKYTVYQVDGASGGGATVYWHDVCPDPYDRRTTSSYLAHFMGNSDPRRAPRA